MRSIRRYYHRKLVRDKIPEIIEAAGDSYKSFVLSITEAKKLMRKKLVEEVRELESSSKEEVVNELVDVLQLVRSIAETENISFQSLERERKKKEKKTGAFKKRIFLVWSDKPAGGKR